MRNHSKTIRLLTLVAATFALLLPSAMDAKALRAPHEEESQQDVEMNQSKRIFRRGNLLLKPNPQNIGINPLNVYRGKRLILRKSNPFDFMWLGFPYAGKPAKTPRSFDGGRRDFISDGAKPTAKPFVDFNGDGIPDLIVIENVGNAGNRYTLYSLGNKARQLGSIMAVRTDAKFMDVDRDGRIETLTFDPTFFGWKTSNAESAMPFIILKLGKRRFALATSLMRAQPPSMLRQEKLLTDWVQGGRDEFARSYKSGVEKGYDKKSFYLAPVVWRDMLDLIYSGNSKVAFRLFDRFWREGRYAGNLESGKDCERVHTSKEKFEEMFLEQLARSPYLDELKKLNRGDTRVCGLRSRNVSK